MKEEKRHGGGVMAWQRKRKQHRNIEKKPGMYAAMAAGIARNAQW